MAGMAIAILTTLALIVKQPAYLGSNLSLGLSLLFVALIVGGGAGAYIAAKVEMTKMPELVAAKRAARRNSVRSNPAPPPRSCSATRRAW